jgi:hypothetical protein
MHKRCTFRNIARFVGLVIIITILTLPATACRKDPPSPLYWLPTHGG